MAAASLFDFLSLLYSASNGKIDFFGEPIIRDMGSYIYRAHICGDYFINFADASPTVNIAGGLAYRYGKMTEDTLLSSFGAFFARKRMENNSLPSGGLGRLLPVLVNFDELSTVNGSQPLLRDVWLADTQVFAARDREGSERGFYVAAKGGTNYAESHSHNDIGNFILYYNGRPVLIDIGVGTYTSKTFSPQRYDIWTMQSSYHNLPTINGIMQKNGNHFIASEVSYLSDSSYAEFSLNIAGAYPPEAGVDYWERKIRLDRNKQVLVRDSYRLKQKTKDLYFSLMTNCHVKLASKGRIILQDIGDQENEPFNLSILYDNLRLEAELDPITLEDAKLKSFWGDGILRITLRAKPNVALKDTFALRIVR